VTKNVDVDDLHLAMLNIVILFNKKLVSIFLKEFSSLCDKKNVDVDDLHLAMLHIVILLNKKLVSIFNRKMVRYLKYITLHFS
jgi:hypothetical protein